MDRPAQQLVFDVGGTQLRAAVCNGADGSLADTRATAAPSYVQHPTFSWDALRMQLISEMSNLRRALDPHGRLRSAIVAFPGPIDRAHRVLAAPTLWGRHGVYPYGLARELHDAWKDTRVSVINDVTAAGYRYMRDAEDEFCIVTLSTGVGNKVFIRGKPMTGAAGAGGEIGHLQVDGSPDAAVCDCGGTGHLGAIASGRGTAARARAKAEAAPDAFRASHLAADMGMTPATLTPEALALAYGRLDPWATSVVERGLDALAGVFAAIHLATGVDRFVLVGGFAFGLGPRFRGALSAATNARCWDGAGNAVSVALGQPDGSCALIGGGRAAHWGLLDFVR